MNKKINDYIKLESSKGISLEDIIKGLQKAGWADDEINSEIEAFKKTQKIDKKEPSKHFDKNWLYVIIPIIILGIFFYFSSVQSPDSSIEEFDWLSLGDDVFNLPEGDEDQICHLSEFANAIKNPSSKPDGIILNDYIGTPQILFESSDIYNSHAIKTKNIEECNLVDDKVLGEMCRAIIGKDTNICTDNAVVNDFCTANPDDETCGGNNWNNICMGFLNQDTSYCDNTDFSVNCKRWVLFNSAIYQGDVDLCPKDNLALNLECKTVIEGKSPLPFTNSRKCVESYFHQKSFY